MLEGMLGQGYGITTNLRARTAVDRRLRISLNLISGFKDNRKPAASPIT